MSDTNTKSPTVIDLLEELVDRLKSGKVGDDELRRLKETLSASLREALTKHKRTADAEANEAVSMSSRPAASSTRFAAEAGVAEAQSAIARTIARSEDARGADDDAPPLTYGETRELDAAHAKHGFGVLTTQWIEDAAHEWRQLTARNYTRVPLSRFIELALEKKFAQRPTR